MWILYLLTTLILAITVRLVLVSQKTKRRCDSNGLYYLGNGTTRMIFNAIYGVGFVEDIKNQYEKLRKSGAPMGLSRDFGLNTLTISDPEVIKNVLVKDFEHFTDRRAFKFGKRDFTFKKMLILLNGDPWRELRTKLSPTFTTGKIKRLFSKFDESGKKFVKFLENEIKLSHNGEIDLTEGYSKYTMDIIASATFGMDSHAFDQKEQSTFEKMGALLQFKVGRKAILKMMLMMSLPPSLSDKLGLSFFGEETQHFFSNAIKYSLAERRRKGEKRDDFVQLMLEAREGKLKVQEGELDTFEKDAMLKDKGKISAEELLDDDGIVSNCILFILAGFDTTQSLLLFCAYALALHQDIQDRLRAEIESVLETTNGELTYDGIGRMTYLDMVISETLRFWPPAAATDRLCVKDYKIPGSDFVLKKGEVVVIPSIGIHYDPELYPDPEKFDPERFSPERKSSLNQYVYLPFGQGPRNCIGMRFALAEAKVVISQLVRNFHIQPSPKTPIPMKYAKVSSLKPLGGMHLSLTKIN